MEKMFKVRRIPEHFGKDRPGDTFAVEAKVFADDGKDLGFKPINILTPRAAAELLRDLLNVARETFVSGIEWRNNG